MFFYIDESGHTGSNLFDSTQPILYYGLLSSEVDLDILVEPALVKLRTKLKVPRLHAAELGNKLTEIAEELLHLIKKYDLRFNLYRVFKSDHALISFFDQIFDQGVNLNVPWHIYWTPLRYVMLVKLSYLFDKDTLEKAWFTRIEKNTEKVTAALIDICEILIKRTPTLPDQRSRELINDALKWAKENPEKVNYNVKNKKDFLMISPNLIGFQFVLHGIANRTHFHKKPAIKIIVDQQSQFNKTQKLLTEIFGNLQDVTFPPNGLGLPDITFKNMPKNPLIFSSGTKSAGLELVDIFLWVFKRKLEEKPLTNELLQIINTQKNRGRINELSIDAISARWGKWFDELPEPTLKQKEIVIKTIAETKKP